MSKQEFMDQLREGLDGNVSYEKYRETIEYYEAYFARRMSEGKTEEEVAAELGSGRLIAKTIIETAGQEATSHHTSGSDSGYEKTSHGHREYADGTPKGWHIKTDNMGNTSVCFGKLDFSTVLGKIVIGICLLLLVSLIVLLVMIGIKILLYVVIPLAVILFIVNLIISLVDNHRM